jgi:cobalt-zinc-cadmium efflux system outer membrane protein
VPVVLGCALAASPQVAEARAQLGAVAGRRIAAGVWLPSNPVVAGTLAHLKRGAPENLTATNWSVTLSQELEIAGQRGARVAEADAEAAAAIRRVAVAENEVGAAALAVFFEAAAARDGLRFATELAEAGKALSALAEGRAREALLSGVEADVARAEGVRIGLLRFEAERRSAEASAALALLIGQPPAALALPELRSAAPPELTIPDEAVLQREALTLRGEVGAATMERRVLEARLSLLRRERVPNPTLSAFFERADVNDRIFGVGLALPLPLPAPVGQTRAGEIAETLAQIRASESSAELVRRRVTLEVSRALAAYGSRRGAAALFGQDLLARARTDLSSLREALSARQLSLRDAIAWQRSLVELLQNDLETRLAYALAVVELQRAGGLPLANLGGGAR